MYETTCNSHVLLLIIIMTPRPQPCGGDGKLAEAETAIVRRDTAVDIDLKLQRLQAFQELFE